MTIEAKRGCGYRKINGLYLTGSGINVTCDRLPFEIKYCPTCGSGIKFTQGFTWLDWNKYAGEHEGCSDKHTKCYLCLPSTRKQPYGLMWVGESFYTPQSFIKEAIEMGVSKRIPFIPKELKLRETVILLAHKKTFYQVEGDDGKSHDYPGIFYAFIPKAVEMLVFKSDLTKEKEEELAKRNITPIPIPNNDPDHSSGNVTIGYDPETKRFSRILLE